MGWWLLGSRVGSAVGWNERNPEGLVGGSVGLRFAVAQIRKPSYWLSLLSVRQMMMEPALMVMFWGGGLVPQYLWP